MTDVLERRDHFDELADVERELDALQLAGRLTQTAFEHLLLRATAAADALLRAANPRGLDSRDHLLRFLTSAGPAQWSGRSEGDGNGVRVPAHTASVMQRVRTGGIPRAILTNSSKCFWNGKHLSSVVLDLVDHEDRVRLEGRCARDDLEFMVNATPVGEFVRTRLVVEFPDGWVLTAKDATVVSTKWTDAAGHLETVSLAPGSWHAVKANLPQPTSWVAAVYSRLPRCFGNLNIETRPAFVSRGDAAASLGRGSAWGNLRVQANYTCSLIVGDRALETHWLVVEADDGLPNRDLLWHDLHAIEFALGCRLRLGTFHAVADDEVVGLLGWSSRPAVDAHGPGPAIYTDFLEHQGFIPHLAEQVAKALAKDETPLLSVATDAYVDSNDSHIDRNMRTVLDGLQAIAVKSLPQDSPELRAVHQGWQSGILRAALAKARLMPTDDLMVAEAFRDTLDRIGALGATRVRSDAQLHEQINSTQFLRSLLVALVAHHAEYVGPIAGSPIDQVVPTWWPFDVNSTAPPPMHFAATAPSTVRLPSTDMPCIFVADASSEAVVRILMAAAGMESSTAAVFRVVGSQMKAVANAASKLGARAIVVVPTEQRHLPSATASFRSGGYTDDSVVVVPAIPAAAAWLLADDRALRSICRGDAAKIARISSLPAPDEVMDPERTLHELVGPMNGWVEVFQGRIDVSYIAGRSASPRLFLSTLATATGRESKYLPEESVARSLSRDVLASLLRQTMPEDVVAWRTSDGSTHTAGELSRAVEVGSDIGIQYVTAVVAVVMNLLGREARRK